MSDVFTGGLSGLSKARTDLLLNLTSKQQTGNYDEIATVKALILEDLYKDSDLLTVINNPELEGCDPEDYRDVNIFSYIKIPETQSVVKNFVCFEVNDREALSGNNAMIYRQIFFRVIAHKNDVNTVWGVDRQDLLGLIIKDRFSWSNCLGMQLKKIYDCGKVSENGYYYRDIYYETTVTNGLYKATTQNALDKGRRGVYDKRSFD